MNWTALWIKIFGTTQLMGIDMGFWVSMGAAALVTILMNIVFWGMKPRKENKKA